LEQLGITSSLEVHIIMRTILIAAAMTLFIAGGGTLWAESPSLLDGVLVESGGSPISLSQMSAATTSDWNNDGKKDLVLGEGAGYVYFYANTGTDIDPQFNGGVRLTSSGSPIQASYASG
jgi:hypothetical protein